MGQSAWSSTIVSANVVETVLLGCTFKCLRFNCVVFGLAGFGGDDFRALYIDTVSVWVYGWYHARCSLLGCLVCCFHLSGLMEKDSRNWYVTSSGLWGWWLIQSSSECWVLSCVGRLPLETPSLGLFALWAALVKSKDIADPEFIDVETSSESVIRQDQ